MTVRAMLVLHVGIGLLLFTVPSECLQRNQYCGDGVQTAVSSFTFKGTKSDDFWDNVCTNELGIISLGAGVKTQCSSSELRPSWELLQGYCAGSFLTLPDWADLIPALSDEVVRSLQVVDFTDIDETKIWNSSVLISPALFQESLRTTTVFEKEYILHQRYGWAMYGFWGSILVIGMGWRAVNYISMASHRNNIDTEAHAAVSSHTGASSWLSGIVMSVEKHLILPPVFDSHHKEPVWMLTVSTRLETIILAAYWILNLVLCCVTYEIFYPNLYYDRTNQVWRYVADRTGIMAYANLPWLWIFAGRNNIFMPLTGWSFGTFNLFHRHIACVVTIEAIVHSISYTALEINFHGLAESWTQKYWYMGAISTICMGLLIGLSADWFRKHTYQLFLLAHIVFAVLTVVGLFYHTAIFEGEYDGYLWPVVAIWLFDRFARLARMIYCNLHLRLSGDVLTTKAVVRYHERANILTMEVDMPQSTLLRPAAGQHYFIYQPSLLRFWENHPFSLASWTSLETSVAELKSPAISLPHASDKEIMVESAQKTTASPDSTDKRSQLSTTDVFHFIIRPHTTSGFTHRLVRTYLSSPDHSITTRLLLEGSYNTSHPLHLYESLIFVVGGSGVAAAIPYLLEYISARNKIDANAGTSKKTWRTKEVTLIWATREPEMLQYVVEAHLHPIMACTSISCRFYVTSKAAVPRSPSVVVPIVPDKVVGSDGDKEHVIEGGDKAAATENISALFPSSGETSSVEDNTETFKVACTHARPDIPAIVDGLLEASLPGIRTSVFVCGPMEMADQTRNSVRQALRRGGKVRAEVRYFEEDFRW